MSEEIPLTRQLYKIIEEKWNSFQGLLALLIVESLFLSPYFFNNFDQGISLIEFGILFLVLFITIFYWGYSRKYPKNKKNLGILIAITTENKEEYTHLKNDLIDKIRNTIEKHGMDKTFCVLELQEFRSKQIKNQTLALHHLKKTKCDLIIYGLCKRRFNKEGGESYYIDAEAAVIHDPIPKIIGDQFSREFAELFPRKVTFQTKEEILGFEVTQQWMSVVARYIIAITLNFSKNFDESLLIFQELSEELKSSNFNIEQINKLNSRMPKWIVVNSLNILNKKYFIYRKFKEFKFLEEMEPFLKLVSKIDPSNYHAHLMRAVFLFLAKRDVAGAKKEIKKSKNNIDVSWRYSHAFLAAYEGNLDVAEKQYKKAFKCVVTADSLFQIEEFIYDVLAIEPDKCQLWYCIGMLNWKIKEDNKLATEAFNKFLDCKYTAKFDEQKRKVREYLKCIF